MTRFKRKQLQIRGHKHTIHESLDTKLRPEAPIVVFLHGGPGMSVSHLVEEIFPELEKTHKIIIWDQLGSGLSYSSELQAQDLSVRSAIEDLKILLDILRKNYPRRKCILVGHSYGGLFGVYAIQDKYIQKCISHFIALHPWIETNEDKEKEVILKRVEEIAKTYQKVYENKSEIIAKYLKTGYWIDQYLAPYGYDTYSKYTNWDYQEKRVNTSQVYSNEEKENYAKGMALSESLYQDVTTNYNPTKDISNIPIRTTFVSAEYDLITPTELLNDFLSKISGNYSHIHLPETNHYSFLDQPDSIKKIIQSIHTDK
jgi:pimeloyl-ACP methyl ester carboxylesterase